MIKCLLLLALTCGTPVHKLLTTTHTLSAFADTYTTQRIANVRELDPITRAFQTNGRAVAYTSTLVGVDAAAYLGERMSKSDNRVVRKLWWVPQVALSAASFGCAIHNLGVK